MKHISLISLLLLALIGFGTTTPGDLRAAPVASIQLEVERAEIDALLLETALILRGQNSGTEMISFSQLAADSLRANGFDLVGFGRPRYVLARYVQSDESPNQVEIGAILVFTDALLRRASFSVLLKATWSPDGQHVTVDHAQADSVTPPQVQMTLAIVPAARIPADVFTAFDHAQILPWIIANRASPAELESLDGRDYVLFAMVFDRLNAGANLQLLISKTPDGLGGKSANGKDLNYENWHIAVMRGVFKWQSDPKFFVKVVHTDPSAPELSTVIGVLSSDLAVVDDKGQLVGNAETDVPNASADGEQKVNAVADSHVYAYNYLNWNKSNWGVFQNLGAGWHPEGGEKRAYLKFDVSDFASQNVGKATLKLFHYHTGGGSAVALGVHRVTSPWQEGVGTYKPATKARPSEITWVNQPSFDPNPELGFNPGTDRGKWIELDITPLVKSWLAGEPNYGLVIKSQGLLHGRPESQYSFRSREFEEVDKHPVLVLSGSGRPKDAMTWDSETAKSPSKPLSPQYAETFMGCYKDTNTRDLNGYFESGSTMSSSQCVAVCAQRGFAYAGTQYGTQCFCGDSHGAYGSADNCNMPCSGAADEMCGGIWANSVYAVGVNEVGAAGSGTVFTEVVSGSNSGDDVIAVSETDSPLNPEGPAKAGTYLAQGKELLSQAYWSDDPTARNALFVQALDQFEQAQELGSAEAIYHIGFMYEIGNAVPQDNDIALSYYDAAARSGYAEGYAQAILVMNQLRRYDQAAQTFFAFTKAFPKAAMLGFDDNAYSDQVSKAIQQVLKRAGNYSGAIDGIIGPGTRTAITQFVANEMPDEVIQPDPVGRSGTNTGGTTDGTQAAGSSQAMELAFWTSIEASTDPADFEAYLQKWPDGVFAVLALNRLKRLGSVTNSAQASNQASDATAGIYTPVHGSAERSAIMDAARRPVGADLGQPVIFVVDELRSDGEWAYLQAVPKRPDGTSINYAATQFAGAWQHDMMTDLVMVLLRNQNGQMRVVDYVIGPTDVYWYTWVEAYGLPETFFFPG